MLSNSVEGLTPDNVTVIDSQGRVLAAQGALGGGDTFGQLEYRRRIESDLASKATAMLDQMLGTGKSVVRVTADVDFTRTQREEKTFDPDLKVRTHEKIRSVSRTTASGLLAGSGTSPGANAAAIGGGSPAVETEEENDAEYQTAYTVDTVTHLPGRLTRLTVAAMVSLPGTEAPEDAESEKPATTTPGVSREQIESLIKQAVGFDTSRGDQIEVVVSALEGHRENEEFLANAQKWEFYQTLARNSSLGIASVVGLFLGTFALRRIKPQPPSIRETGDEERTRRLRVVSELSQKAQENPDIIKAVVTSWLHGDNRDKGESVSRKAA
jgi:flagellar M-ring protein FliF